METNLLLYFFLSSILKPLRRLSNGGGESLLDEKLTTSILTLELEKLGNRIQNDLENFSVEYDGSLKDIATGTHIKIPLDAGYVNFWTSQTDFSIRVYLNLTMNNIP